MFNAFSIHCLGKEEGIAIPSEVEMLEVYVDLRDMLSSFRLDDQAKRGLEALISLVKGPEGIHRVTMIREDNPREELDITRKARRALVESFTLSLQYVNLDGMWHTLLSACILILGGIFVFTRSKDRARFVAKDSEIFQ
jgi:hypothetical protein